MSQELSRKFVIVARHGELDNPTNVVYNRDSVMGDNIIHLSAVGRQQMRQLGTVLIEKGFHIKKIVVSPETRARESAEALNAVLNVQRGAITVSDDLDDTYSPGPFIEQMTMDDLATIGGDVYTGERWKQYGHEQPVQIVSRMRRVFLKTAASLEVGQTAILVSHGDPIAWLLNTISGEDIPHPKTLRSLMYPAKGEGVTVTLGPDNNVHSLYSLQSSDHTGKIY